MTFATLQTLAPDAQRRALQGDGLNLQIGPFKVRLQTDALTDFQHQLATLYAHYPLSAQPQFADYHVTLFCQRGARRWWRPQVQFDTDGDRPFAPFPADTALPFWEWGLNYCIATRAHQYLLLHAGVLERDGRALLLPAKPGSGKSTLSAALSQRGWRFLSDEFALIRPADLTVVPLPRLVPLKNRSIEVIKAFAPDALIGPEFPKTRKGRVAHYSPPAASLLRSSDAATPTWVVFPQYTDGATATLRPFARELAFLKLSSNSFNYEFIGERGFTTASRLIEQCQSFTFEYGDLDEAVACFDALAAER